MSFGVLTGEPFHLVIVDAVIVARTLVGHHIEPLARLVDRRAVGQVAAAGQVEAEKGVARLQQGEEHRLVGLGAGMGLDIGILAPEQLLGAVDRQGLGDVDELAAAVIAPAGIALGIFVGQHRALRLDHGARDDVLRRDELDLVLLAAEFLGDRLGKLGVGPIQVSLKKPADRSSIRPFHRRHGVPSLSFLVMPARVAGIHDHRRRKSGTIGDHGLPGQARQ
jgi:hypothetical protein